MLVIAQNIVLSEAEEAIPGTPLIGWHNIVTFGNIEADSEDLDFPASNLANPATNLEWRADSGESPLPTEWNVDVTTNYLEGIDYVGIARHNFGTAQIAVSIEKSDGESPEVWEELVQEQIPPNDEPLLFRFTEESIARIRIKMSDGDDVPTMAVVYVGKLLVCERGVVVDKDLTPPRFGRRTDAINGRSERGDFLGRIVMSQFIETVVDFAHFTPAWYRSYFAPFVEEAQRDVPFFYAWLPDDYPYEVAYCWLTDDPMMMTNPVTRRVAVQLKLGGITE